MGSPKIKVMVVDDSVVIRRMVSNLLDADPDIEVIGTAANGRIALTKLAHCRPDIVTLDMEMPELSGIETVIELRKLYPDLPVIMFSSATEKGAKVTFEALAKGASDYVTKPANLDNGDQALENVRTELVPKIKAFCRRDIGSKSPVSTIDVEKIRTKVISSSRTLRRIDAVAIGVSTGGPNALADVIPRFPKAFPVPIFIVQHMPPLFTKYLADSLNSRSNLPVTEVVNNEVVEPGHVYLAQGGFHMRVVKVGDAVRLVTNQDPPENSCRPAVDVMFRSVAEVYGHNLLAVILTGMGYDGLRGSEVVIEKGGRVIAQDETTSVVWGMPGAVAKAGIAEDILPVSRVAEVICRRAGIERSVAWMR